MKPEKARLLEFADVLLAKAENALKHARFVTDERLLEDQCYHAQQAAEKAIKALMVAHGIRFPYTHNLGELLASLEEAGKSVPPEILHVDELTKFAGAPRYSRPKEPVTMSEWTGYLQSAERTVEWARERIKEIQSI